MIVLDYYVMKPQAEKRGSDVKKAQSMKWSLNGDK
jgi:hypothetical protein